MIINIAGTSGSGKSTAIRAIMAQLYGVNAFYENQYAKRPLGYWAHTSKDSWKKVVIVGPYQSSTGGCDSLPNLKLVFDTVLQFATVGAHVLFEGLLVSRSKGRMVRLWHQFNSRDLYVYHLCTSFEDCIEGINARRRERGEMEPVDLRRTAETYYRVLKIVTDLENLGVPVKHVSREEVVPMILEQLRNG